MDKATEMYEHRTPKQRINLTYGYKLRIIHCLLATVTNGEKYAQIFTKEEAEQVRRIHEAAIERARNERDAGLRLLSTTETGTNSGIAEESRQYTGK